MNMKKYCVIQLGVLRDLLQTKRLIASLLAEGAHVHLCVAASRLPQASVLYPETTVHGLQMGTQMDALTANMSLFEELKQEMYAGVYNLHDTPANFALSTLFPPDIMHGYWLENGTQRCSEEFIHISRQQERQNFLNKMDMWGHLAAKAVPSHTVNPIAMRKGDGIGVVLRDNHGCPLPADILAGCINSVCTATREKDVVLFGNEGDEVFAGEVLKHVKEGIAAKAVTRCFAASLAEDMERISALNMLITPNSDLMHVAAHLGVPVNAFFYSSAWVFKDGPYGLGHRIWQVDTSCSPCDSQENCTDELRCIQVFGEEQFQRFLGGKIDQNYPPDVTGYVSMLDGVGVTYMPVFGAEEHAAERLDLRGIAAEFFGVTSLSNVTDPVHATSFYKEQDWMLSRSMSCEEVENGL